MRHNKSLERDFCYAGCAYSAKAPQLRRYVLFSKTRQIH